VPQGGETRQHHHPPGRPNVNDLSASARRTTPQLLPASPVGCQYFFDPAEAVDQSGDVSLGGGLLGVFQGQHQLPAGFEPAIVDLTDGITVLQPHRVFELASPQAEAAQS
jgi:hypothetical protein